MIKEKLRIAYPIIVEGKYDRLRLLCVADAKIITTDGFAIFRKQDTLALLRKLAEKSPLIVLTDSDGAGKLIRSHITSAIPKDKLIQLYIPRIEGVEKRKAAPSAEGVLGVEGMEEDMLYRLLKPYENTQAFDASLENPLSKADFYADGLSGCCDSSKKRDELCMKLGLPVGMTANALLSALKIICTYDEYLSIVGRG